MSGCIDVFVHPKAEHGMASFAPYLPEAWTERFKGLGVGERECFHGADPAAMTAGLLSGPVDEVVMVPVEAVNAWPDANLVVHMLTAANEYFLQEWAPRDERFRLAGLVCGQDPRWSAKEIRRLAAHDDVVAVALAPMHLLLGDAHYFPIYEACVETGFPLIIHPTGAEGLYVGAPQTAGGVALTHLERRTLVTQIAQSNIASLVFQGVFARFPELRVLFAGFGFSWLFPILWRMDMEWRRTRVETPWVKEPPTEYVRRHIRLTTEPNDAPADVQELSEMLEMASAQSVLVYGSDFPVVPPEQAHAFAQSLREPVRSQIMRESALTLFPRLAANRVGVARA
jgi:predicted TIM-barrel fold metal-dependent hydrolase